MKTLHNKPTSEIAAALAVALKSRPNIVKLTYHIGDYIELVSKV